MVVLIDKTSLFLGQLGDSFGVSGHVEAYVFNVFLSDALSRESSKEIKNALLLHYTRCKYKEISYPSTTQHIFNIGFFLYNTLLDFLGGRSIIKFCSFSQIRIIFLKIGNLKKEGGK